MKIAITGGHHTSALPIIRELNKRLSDLEIIWFGHKFSSLGNRNPTLEFNEIKSLGIRFYDLKAGKVYKTYNLKRIIKVPFGFIQAFFLLIKERPDFILSFGGYLAPPVVLAGWLLGIPSFTHEQTVVSGYANKFVSKFAKKIFITWPQSGKYFPSNKVVLTGLPLRAEIFTATTSSFKVNESLPTIYISAGKSGSHKINLIVKEALGELLSFCNVIHQCGDHSLYNDYGDLARTYEDFSDSLGMYFVKKFITSAEVGEAFVKADLVLGRSGAHFISEVLALRKPAILIPIPWTSHNEQVKNAELLVNYGIAKLLEEDELSKDSLITMVGKSLENIDTFSLEGLDERIFPRLNAAELIVDEVLDVISRKD